MSNETAAEREYKRGFIDRAISVIETVGNKLPHPFWLFMIFNLIILVISIVASRSHVSATWTTPGVGGAQVTTVTAVSLLSYDAVRTVFANLVKTYAGFPPLGLILVMMLGIGIVEQTGLISALMRKSVMGAPAFLVTAILAVVGLNAHLASDAGILFTSVLGASVFRALGLNPWVGIVTGYASANAGYIANFFIAGTDALLAGITQSAAISMHVHGPTHPLINYYFGFVSVITLTLATVFVTEKITVRHLGGGVTARDEAEFAKHRLTPEENRGLRWALVALVVYVALILYFTIPQGSLFRSPNGSLLPNSPLMASIMTFLFLFFFIVGSAYGIGCGAIKKGADIPKLMAKGLEGSIAFMVVVLPAALFVQLFALSRLDVILSVRGAQWLESIHMNGVLLLVVFVLMVALLDLLIMSGSAKWLILAPIFVPMLAQVGMPPALVQAAYRVGDSCLNPISPVSYYIPVVLGLLEQYRPENQKGELGIGTVISLCLPYTIAYLVVLLIQLIVWYLLGLPLGPGVPIHM